MISEIVTISLISIITWYIWDWMDSYKQPPGPVRFPIVGNLVQVALADPKPYKAFEKLSNKYGQLGVTRIQMGTLNAIVADSAESIKHFMSREECLSRHVGGELMSRTDGKNIGIVMSVGTEWQDMRKYIVRKLREFGFNKRAQLEEMISVEVEEVFQHIDSMATNKKTIHFDALFFSISSVNILLNMVTGKRYSRTDPTSALSRFVKTSRAFMDAGVVGAGIYTAFPILKQICPGLVGYTKMVEIIAELKDICRQSFHEMKEDGSYKISQDCFAHHFLSQMNPESRESEYEKSCHLFTEEQFVVTLMDLIQAGSDTTSSAMSYSVLLLASHPEVQQNFLKEILKVVGPDRYPLVQDRDKMPYTQAVITECLRWARVAIVMPRLVTKDFIYEDKFLIRKDTAILCNYHSASMSKVLFGDPDNFRPERFLNDAGEFVTKEADKTIAFGYGKRNCIGEVLGRDTMFMFLSSLVRRYNLSLPTDRPKPSLEPLVSITGVPAPYDLVVSLRDQLL